MPYGKYANISGYQRYRLHIMMYILIFLLCLTILF